MPSGGDLPLVSGDASATELASGVFALEGERRRIEFSGREGAPDALGAAWILGPGQGRRRPQRGRSPRRSSRATATVSIAGRRSRASRRACWCARWRPSAPDARPRPPRLSSALTVRLSTMRSSAGSTRPSPRCCSGCPASRILRARSVAMSIPTPSAARANPCAARIGRAHADELAALHDRDGGFGAVHTRCRRGGPPRAAQRRARDDRRGERNRRRRAGPSPVGAKPTT